MMLINNILGRMFNRGIEIEADSISPGASIAIREGDFIVFQWSEDRDIIFRAKCDVTLRPEDRTIEALQASPMFVEGIRR